MSVWEYKVISSGKGGFATPALLESFLNQLGKDEWEIIEFRTQSDNALAFSGLARRSTQRDWTLQDAAAAAAKAEADKLRAEFEAKFRSGSAESAAGQEGRPEEVPAADDGFRKLRDTERDLDPDAAEDEPEDEWDKLGSGDELPTFFEAARPHMRRNQRGPGLSVGIDYLAKKWEISEDDVLGALKECGLSVPDEEDAKADYLEYDGDLYWVNMNRRGELWLNTKEKPSPIFRTVQGTRVAPVEEPVHEVVKAAAPEASSEAGPASAQAEGPEPKGNPDGAEGHSRPRARTDNPPRGHGQTGGSGTVLPQGPSLLDRIRPLMRRNRREPGGSGSVSFLSRGLKCSEATLIDAFAALGLVLPAVQTDKAVPVEIDGLLWWVNKDQRGGVWINAREKTVGEPPPGAPAPVPAGEAGTVQTGQPAQTEAPVQPDQPAQAGEGQANSPGDASSPVAQTPVEPASQPAPGHALAAVRLLLKETRTGGVAAIVDRLSAELGKTREEFLGGLTAAGLRIPERPREKPVFVEHAGEIFWINVNAKGELWLNAKASKFGGDADESDSGGGEAKRGRRPRGKKKADSPDETDEPPAMAPADLGEAKAPPPPPPTEAMEPPVPPVPPESAEVSNAAGATAAAETAESVQPAPS
jgi:hypothetical protein